MLRFRLRLSTIAEHDGPLMWTGLAGMIAAASPFFVTGGMALATGLGRLADVILLLSGILLAIRMGAFLIGLILVYIPVKLPRVFIGYTIATGTALTLTWTFGQMYWLAAMAMALATMAIGFFAGTAVYWLVTGKRSVIFRTIYGGCSAAFVIIATLWVFDVIPQRTPTYVVNALGPEAALELDADDPSMPGLYTYTTFTYGSGKDRQRRAFGDSVDIVVPMVDGSSIIDHLDWSRRWLWGIDINQLPVNGWGWMPDGEGPFPLVLIVHGNHKMAEFSDTGYDYLGELLASRGFIAVSVDENFLNHSTWSGGIGSLDEDMTLRAWMLLQHLIAIEELTGYEGNALSGKVDMNRIALIGHSRGGQAAVLATQFDRFYTDVEQPYFRIGKEFNIQAVVAMAPTDFQVYKQTIEAQDINYLVLQGSNDADVNTFFGDRQYRRILYSGNELMFKSSLYIRGANHGQFNTGWGRMDVDFPTQLLLDKNELLGGEEQRKIAKVYIAGFLESVFHERSEYVPMFQDYRYALTWLPETEYVNRYMEAEFVALVDPDENLELEEGNFGIEISTDGVSEWSEEELLNRRGLTQINRVLTLEWEDEEAAYVLRLPDDHPLDVSEEAMLAFSLADLSGSDSPGLSADIELVDEKGEVASVSLEDFAPAPAPIEAIYLKAGVLEPVVKDSELATSAEPVMQTYQIPLMQFAREEPAFDPGHLAEIRFKFTQSSGKVILDEIGLYLSPRS